MFFITLFSLMIALDLLWWRRADAALRLLPRAGIWRALLATFVLVLAGCMLLFLVAPALVRRAHGFLPLPLHALVYLWHLLVLPVTWVFLLTGDIGGRTIRRFRKRSPAKVFNNSDASTAEKTKEPLSSSPEIPVLPIASSLSRRQFLGAAAVALPPLIATGTMGWGLSQLGTFRVNQFDLPLPGLSHDLDGLRIVQVSDMHVGKFTVAGMLKRVADAVNRTPDGERPDHVLLTGDLIDLSISDLPSAIDFVRTLDPRHGLTMIEGNHDLIDDPMRFYKDVEAAGIPLLIDESRIVQFPGRPTPLQLLGMRWSSPAGGMRGGESQIQSSMAGLLPQRQPDAFPILLAHHPHAFDPAAAAGIPLTLAGHTHGGQVMLTRHIGPGPLVYRYWSGLYQKHNSRLFVSNGIGNWFPLRLNAPAEIVHITLRAV